VCDHADGSVVIYQCANHKRLSSVKAKEDIEKIAAGGKSPRSAFKMIVGGSVTGGMKDTISAAALTAGFSSCETWSGVEFEERLRRDAPDLLLRFTQGVPFPEIPQEIAAFIAQTCGLGDDLIVRVLTAAFDRPAYKTPFRSESSLPRFRAAITESIDTINTGRTQSGRVLPAKNDVADPAKRAALSRLVERLVSLRAAFEGFVRSGDITHCACASPDCPVFFMPDMVAHEMDLRRKDLLREVQQLNPAFDPSFYTVN
jgi:hypothetical protein